MKKFIMTLLSGVMVLGSIVGASAAQTYTADGTSTGTDVSFTKAAGFMVTIPEAIVLSLDGTGADAQWVNSDVVLVEGSIASNQDISVEVAKTVALATAEGGAYVADVAYAGSADNKSVSPALALANGVATDDTFTFGVSTEDNRMEAGTWEGVMTFDIALNTI